MLNLTVNCEVKSREDVMLALEEAFRVFKTSGCISGQDGNEDGNYSYFLSGEEEIANEENK